MWKFSRLELYSGLRVKKHSLSIGVFSFLISYLVFEIFSKKLLYVLVVVWFLLGIYCMWIYLTHTIKVSALWMGTEYARFIACGLNFHCMLYSLQYKCTPDSHTINQKKRNWGVFFKRMLKYVSKPSNSIHSSIF